MDPLIDRHNGSVSLREAYRPADEYGVRSAVELEVDNIPVQKVIFKPFILCSVMGGRKTYRKLHIHDLILAVVGSGKLKGNGKQREDKIPFVSRLVPHIRDALIGEGIIFALVEKDILSEGRPGVAFPKSGHKGPVVGLDLFISVVDTD